MTTDDRPDGRTYFTSLEAALSDFAPPVENRPRIRELVAAIDSESIYIPPSRTYIAIVPRSGGRIVAIHYGYVDGLRDADGVLYGEALPVNALRDGGSTRVDRADETQGVCPSCFIALPTSGVCDACEG